MLGLSVIESAVPPTATTEVTLLAHELRDRVSDILGGDATLDQDRLAEYCRPLVERLGDGATEASVQWTAEDALAGPRRRAIWVLQAQGIDAEVVGELLVVRSDAGNLPLEAVRAIAAVEDCDKNAAGAWAVGQHGAVLAVWKTGQLHVYEPASSRWVSYRAISPFSNPRTWSSQRALPTQQRTFRRGVLPPDDAARVLVELNIDPTQQPIPPA
jgi:hypothetical protein